MNRCVTECSHAIRKRVGILDDQEQADIGSRQCTAKPREQGNRIHRPVCRNPYGKNGGQLRRTTRVRSLAQAQVLNDPIDMLDQGLLVGRCLVGDLHRRVIVQAFEQQASSSLQREGARTRQDQVLTAGD